MIKTYTYCIKPGIEQQQVLTRLYGICRYIFNKGLEKKMGNLITGNKVSCIDLMRDIKGQKQEHVWLEECPVQCMQMALRNLDNQYTKFIKGSDNPLFRNKYKEQSIQFSQGVVVKFKNNTIKLPRVGIIPCIYDRRFAGKIKMVTVTKTLTEKYVVKVIVDTGHVVHRKSPVHSIGISTGINTLYALSNGTRVSQPERITKSERNVAIQQRSLYRKQKASKRAVKQLKVLTQAKEKLCNQKRDYMHKVSTKIIKDYDTIVIEKGYDQLREMLRYKSLWYGNNIVVIGVCSSCPDICSTCGTINNEEKLATWVCKNCDSAQNKNNNYALNVKKIGQRKLPSVANSVGNPVD